MPAKSNKKGNIVESWVIGGTRVKINDAYIVAKTRDDPKVLAVLERIGQIYYYIELEKLEKERQKQSLAVGE